MDANRQQFELSSLLARISPVLHEDRYIFVTFDYDVAWPPDVAVGMIREKEGISVILPLGYAEAHQLEGSAPFSRITLEIHSSLEAVGLTAAFSKVLSEAGISCNVMAGYHHDHLFVPSQDAQRALGLLLGLQRDSHRE
jgi:hypothetical protein